MSRIYYQYPNIKFISIYTPFPKPIRTSYYMYEPRALYVRIHVHAEKNKPTHTTCYQQLLCLPPLTLLKAYRGTIPHPQRRPHYTIHTIYEEYHLPLNMFWKMWIPARQRQCRLYDVLIGKRRGAFITWHKHTLYVCALPVLKKKKKFLHYIHWGCYGFWEDSERELRNTASYRWHFKNKFVTIYSCMMMCHSSHKSCILLRIV